jgi:predicted dehydrogenase/NADPH:quinone reductase-like Zn-dependent oxidoreductase
MGVLIRTRRSLISAGTERMLVEFSQANLLQKARQQPERVRQVLDKVRADGLLPTLETVFQRLDEPLPLGYCNAGVVIEAGSEVADLSPGDRVASNGPHAQIVAVPRHLCARIPDSVTDDAAAFTVLGAIALQGIRLAQPTLGERFVVFGVGLLGLITVQLLRAHGCEVLAVDLDSERLRLAAGLGARTVDVSGGGDPVAAAAAWTKARGADGCLITASAKGDEIVHQAAQATRQRGRIVLVGVVGLSLRRQDFYEKELSFQVSCSYGPGRYDDSYEQRGQDYPFGFVRWTEQRNFDAVLAAMESGRLAVEGLLTHRYGLDQAAAAYETIQNDRSALGVVLEYEAEPDRAPAVSVESRAVEAGRSPGVAVIGAGNFARGVLLPALVQSSADLLYVANCNPATAAHAARKFGARQAVTDHRLALDDPDVAVVFVVVSHQLHAELVIQALEAGKHVFVEKPLALDEAELDRVAGALSDAEGRLLMVGYNRRFSRHVERARGLLSGRSEPLCMTMTVNAGQIPPDHWTQDPKIGGGRIVGEACHFIDLMAHLADSPVVHVSAFQVDGGTAIEEDKMSLVLGFADGSIGNLNYFANGAKSYSKERLLVFSDGRILELDNFRSTIGFGFDGFRRFRTRRQDKGHAAEVSAFIERLRNGGRALIPFDSLRNTSRATFAIVRSARERRVVALDERS